MEKIIIGILLIALLAGCTAFGNPYGNDVFIIDSNITNDFNGADINANLLWDANTLGCTALATTPSGELVCTTITAVGDVNNTDINVSHLWDANLLGCDVVATTPSGELVCDTDATGAAQTYPNVIPWVDVNVANDITASNYRRLDVDINFDAIADWNSDGSLLYTAISICGDGEILKVSTDAWVCAEDATGGGSSTYYTAGSNLILDAADENRFRFNDGNFLSSHTEIMVETDNVSLLTNDSGYLTYNSSCDNNSSCTITGSINQASDVNNVSYLSYLVIADPPWITSASADTNWQTSFAIFDLNMKATYVQIADSNNASWLSYTVIADPPWLTTYVDSSCDNNASCTITGLINQASDSNSASWLDYTTIANPPWSTTGQRMITQDEWDANFLIWWGRSFDGNFTASFDGNIIIVYSDLRTDIDNNVANLYNCDSNASCTLTGDITGTIGYQTDSNYVTAGHTDNLSSWTYDADFNAVFGVAAGDVWTAYFAGANLVLRDGNFFDFNDLNFITQHPELTLNYPLVLPWADANIVQNYVRYDDDINYLQITNWADINTTISIMDTNAQKACDGNSALTGDGDCVIITGFDIQGAGQRMITQDEWDANFLIWWGRSFDGNFQQSFDGNILIVYSDLRTDIDNNVANLYNCDSNADCTLIGDITGAIGYQTDSNYVTAGHNDNLSSWVYDADFNAAFPSSADGIASYLAGANLFLRPDTNTFDVVDNNLFDQNRFIVGDYNFTNVGANEFFGNLDSSWVQNPPWLTSVVTWPNVLPWADVNIVQNYVRKDDDINYLQITNWGDINTTISILDTNANTECDNNQALNGSGVCVDLTGFHITIPDTNAATECSAGEFLQGGGLGVCNPLAPQHMVVFDNNIDFSGQTKRLLDLFNGIIIETINVDVNSDGTDVNLSIERDGGGDLNIHYSTGFFNFDTTPPKQVTLTAGSDTSPTLNYVFIPESTKVLTVNTTGFPTNEHSNVAKILVQSAASAQIDGVYRLHVYTDHTADINATDDSEGHLAHLNEWVRTQPATWDNGIVTNLDIQSAASPDDIFIDSTAGQVLQLHIHDFPVFDTEVDSNIFVVNDSVSDFNKVQNLNELLLDSTGATMSGRYFNLVLWGNVSEDKKDSQLFINLPNGSYNRQGDAISDISGFTVLTIPVDFKGSGFLITRYTLRHQAAGGGTWTLIQEADLRGLFPSTAAAGGSGALVTEFADNAFKVFDETDVTKLFAFDVGTLVTTGNTRTITIPDRDLDLNAPVFDTIVDLNLQQSACDVKSTPEGGLYCGTDETGGGTTHPNVLPWADVNVANDITASNYLRLDDDINYLQITNWADINTTFNIFFTNYFDGNWLNRWLLSFDGNFSDRFQTDFDGNFQSSFDGNISETNLSQLVYDSDFNSAYPSGTGQRMITQDEWDANFLIWWGRSFDGNFTASFDGNIVIVYSDIRTDIDNNVANLYNCDSNASCTLTGDITGTIGYVTDSNYVTEGHTDDLSSWTYDADFNSAIATLSTGQRMITQQEWDDNFLVWWDISFDGNFSTRFDDYFDGNWLENWNVSFDDNWNVRFQKDFDGNFNTRFQADFDTNIAATNLSQLIYDADFNSAFPSGGDGIASYIGGGNIQIGDGNALNFDDGNWLSNDHNQTGDFNMVNATISGNLFPIVNNIIDLGKATLRWANGWFVNLYATTLTVTGQTNTTDLNVDSGNISDGATTYSMADLNLNVTNVCSGDVNSIENSAGVCLDVTGWSTGGGSADVNGTDIAPSTVFTETDIYINYDGPDEERCVYWYENSGESNESLCWDDGADRFNFNDDLYVSRAITVGSAGNFAGTIQGSGDIYTTGVNDDFWLGTVGGQRTSNFQAYAAGNLDANGYGCFKEGGCDNQSVGDFEVVTLHTVDANLTNDLNLNQGNINLIDSNICGGIPLNDGSDKLIVHFNEVTTGSGLESGTIILESLMAVWHLDDGNYNATDSSGRANTLTNNGANWIASGRYGSALDFVSASTDNLTRADDSELDVAANKSFTLGFWIKTDNREVSSEETIISKMENGGDFQGYEIMLRTDDSIGFRIREVTTTTANLEVGAVDVTDGEWHFIVVGRDTPGTLYMSIDGAAYTTDASPSVNGNLANANLLHIGSNQTGAAEWFDGTLDEIFFLKGTLLDQNEVAMLHDRHWKSVSYINSELGEGFYPFSVEDNLLTSLRYITAGNIWKEQGTLFIKVEPTWIGEDDLNHFFFDIDGTQTNINEMRLFKSESNALTFEIYDNSANLLTVSTPVSWAVGEVQYIAATWNKGELALYLNGELKDDTESGTGTGEITNWTSYLINIGSDIEFYTGDYGIANARSNHEAKSIIDELAIYKRAKTPEEVYCTYLSLKNGNQIIKGEW